jgi:tetratricopeptide (TPR) repeat protein
MLTLFIGSSTEAKEKLLIVSKLVRGLSDKFDVRPWDQGVDQGRFTLEILLNHANEVDTAVLVFTKDDQRESRGQSAMVTRDNVILEYGLFLGQLGRERVWIFKERGAELPTDLAGLNHSEFNAENDTKLNADIEVFMADVIRKWGNMTPRRGDAEPQEGGLGVSTPLKTIEHQKAWILKNSQIYARSDVDRLQEPLHLDSYTACIKAYSEALDLVTKRFWTTTYLSSGFWIQNTPEILDANKRMLERVRAVGGDVRRIFLLNQPIQAAVDTWQQRLINLRIQGDIKSKRRIRSELHNLKRNLDALKKEGCQVKVVFDDNEYQRLREMDFTHDDSEIAIYDDFRVDVFGGGSVGRITDVAIYSKATSSFQGILSISENYFKDLWRQGESAEEYLDRLEGAYQSFEKQIDYTPTGWLSMSLTSTPTMRI